MKKIVALDAFTLSPLYPGQHSPVHPNWDELASLGDLVLHPRTPEDALISRSQDAEILLTNKTVITANHIAALPKLEYIGVMATGVNVVDLAAARARGIPVANARGYSAASVAQHVFALLLEMAGRTGATAAAVKDGEWARCPDFCFTVAPFFEMAGKTLGVVGFGAIGQAAARIGAAMGMKLMVHSRSEKPFDYPVEWVSLDRLFRESDVITLHCPLTDDTKEFINRENLAKMKPSLYLINTGRGTLVDEAALAEALQNGVIAGYGGDVLGTEPPVKGSPLLSAPNAVITPHMAWASVESRTRLMHIVADNVRAFLAGSPVNVVN